MKFNYQFPLKALKRWEQWSEGHHIADLAVAAEAAGFDVVSSTDHPYPDATWLRQGGHQDFDLFTTLAFMAARTTRVRVLSYVMIAGYRSPYLAARAAATLDCMSDGRLTLGMGAGYLKEEFEVLGASYADRGKRFDAAIKAMQNAWLGEVSDFDDPYYPAKNALMTPRPKQRPGPPIWIGGNSEVSLRRVAEFAQGWLPFEQLPETSKVTGTPALTSVAELTDMIGRLKEMRAGNGDQPLEVCFAPLGEQSVEDHVDYFGRRLPEYEAAGVTYLSYDGRARSWSESLREIELMGDLIAEHRVD